MKKMSSLDVSQAIDAFDFGKSENDFVALAKNIKPEKSFRDNPGISFRKEDIRKALREHKANVSCDITVSKR